MTLRKKKRVKCYTCRELTAVAEHKWKCYWEVECTRCGRSEIDTTKELERRKKIKKWGDEITDEWTYKYFFFFGLLAIFLVIIVVRGLVIGG